MEEERVAFPLYHMNITPRAITLMPTAINRARISFGEREIKGSSHLYYSKHYQTYP